MFNIIEKVYAANAPQADQLGTSIEINQNEQFFSISGLVNFAISWIIYIAGILAFIYLVIAGITYLTAGGNAEQAKKGQTGLLYAIIGIIVVVLAYVILKAVVGIGQANAPA